MSRPAVSRIGQEDVAPLPRPIQDHLGSFLRELYAVQALEALPERLAALVGQIEGALASRRGQGEVEPALRAELLAALSSLRAFAISLCGNHHKADDLVQETMLKAWKNIARFERGTNLNAWLFTILRNQFHSEWRKVQREVDDPDELYAKRLSVLPEQGGRLDLQDLREALQLLPPEQREAVLLVGAEGLSYEEAAAIMKIAVGTVKSRVNRGRGRLAEILGMDDKGDLGVDGVTRAVMGSVA